MPDSMDVQIKRLSELDVLHDVCFGRTTGVEENIKVKVVIPILNLLNYDTTRDMDFEHHVENRRADIALIVDRKPKVIVECKSLDKKLENHKVRALDYARKKGITWILLTNGVEFQIYKSFIEGVEDKKNKPVFSTNIKDLPKTFSELSRLIAQENIREIEEVTKDKVEAIRKSITEEELLETLKTSKQALFYDFLQQFEIRYKTDLTFKNKIDGWIKEQRINTEATWIDQYKQDKNFRVLVNKVLDLDRNIDADWIKRYEKSQSFQSQIDRTLRDNDIQVNWIDKLCSEGAYAFINRILFLRICEDRGFIPIQTSENWMQLMESAISKDKILSLLQILFGDIGLKFRGIYIVPLFDHIHLDDLGWNKDTIIQVIKKTKKHNFKKISRDIIGDVYQHHLSRETRRSLGQFYTPKSIIDFILSKVNINPRTKILDPACGPGGFLISAYDILRKQLREEGWSESKIHEHILRYNLYGIDIDAFATQLTTMNLFLKDLNNPTTSVNVVEGNSLTRTLEHFDEKPSPATKVKTDLSQTMSVSDITSQKFDVVVSNPPYVNIPKSDPIYKPDFEAFYSDIITGVINSSSLFLKKGIHLLNKGGILGFIVPKSLSYIQSYGGIRNYILDNCKIKTIADVGRAFQEVGYEQIIIIVQKHSNKESSSDHSVEIITNIEDLASGRYDTHYTKQSVFQSTGVFSLFLDENTSVIVENMNKGSKKLWDIAHIFRGMGIQGKKYLYSDTSKELHYKEVYGGRNIGRYFQKSPLYLDTKHSYLKSYKNQMERQEVKKIVVQRLVTSKVRIVGTYDEMGAYNFDTITNVVIYDNQFEDKYVLGILNSDLMAFYLRDIIFNRSTLTMDMDTPYLGGIPIKKIPKKKQKKIVDLVDEMLTLQEKMNKLGYSLRTSVEYNKAHRRVNEIDKEINDFVFDIYGLSQTESDLIKSINSMF